MEVRHHMRLQAEQMEEIERLQSDMGAKDRKDTILKALSIAQWIVDKQKKGARITAITGEEVHDYPFTLGS